MRRWHLGGMALLLAAGSITAVGATTASASADPQGKPFDGANLKERSVTYDKLDLADGDIPASKVAGVLSQSALDQLAADLTAGLQAATWRDDQLREQVSTVSYRLEDLRESLSRPTWEPMVHWTNLFSMPDGFADGIDDVDGGRAVDVVCASLCISDAEIAEVSAHKIRGHIASDQLEGNIGSQLIADRSITAADLAGSYGFYDQEVEAGAVTSEKIRDDAVELRDLSPEVRQWLPRITSSTTGTPGGSVTVAAGERAALLLPAAGVRPGDFLSVAPPALSDPLLFAGALSSSPDTVSVWVYNPGASDLAITGTWQVSWISLSP